MTSPSDGPSADSRSRFLDGWICLIICTLSRAYLVFVFSLIAITVLPVLLGWQGSVVQTGSMEPRIRPGDVVLVTPFDPGAQVPVGRVVQYRSPAAAEPHGVDKFRLHRIVSADADGTFTTAGDANAQVDSTPLSRDQITGQAVLLVRLIGLPVYWIGTGNFALFGLWATGTVCALFASALGPRTALATKTSLRIPGVRMGRRSAVILILGSAATGVAIAGWGGRQHAAVYTGATRTAGSTWMAETLPALSPGRASAYALLAAVSITNEGRRDRTTVTGSLGTSPGTSISGFTEVTGSIDRGNEAARDGMSAAAALYDAVCARRTTSARNQNLTGKVIPGVYRSSSGSFTINGALKLDAMGDSGAVFIFVADSLSAAANSSIVLSNGASARNVFWAIATTITLGHSSLNKGNYVAHGGITIHAGSALEGRGASLGGSITTTASAFATPDSD